MPAPTRIEQHTDRVASVAKSWRRVEWVLSRALCRFGRFDLKQVPPAQRHGAIRLRISEWTTFAQTGTCVVLQGDDALIWIWDETPVQQAILAANLGRRRPAIIPETLLHSVHEEATVLLRCLDGYEGQVWRAHQLQSSRWWPAEPDQSAWSAFLRDSGLPPGSKPAIEAPPLSNQAWATPASLESSADWQSEPLFVMSGVLLLGAVTLWTAAELFHYDAALQARKTQLTSFEEAAQPIQQARQSALEESKRIEFLQGLDTYPPIPYLLAEIGRRLPKDGTYLKEFDFQKGRVKLVLAASAKPQTTLLVKAFQESGWFKDVQSTGSNDPTGIVLEMQAVKTGDLTQEMADSLYPVKADSRLSGPEGKKP